MLESIFLAFSFLTILPVPGNRSDAPSPRDLAASFSAYPLVGTALGSLCGLAAWLLSPFVPPALLAALLTFSLAVMTRFLHLDGLADLADGLWGGYTVQRRLEIMKDSCTGSFGAAALCLILMTKSASFFTLLSIQAWPTIFIAPALSRYAMVLAAHGSVYARREGGLGQSFLTHMTSADLIRATIIAAVVSISFSILYGPALFAAAALSARAMKRLAHRMLGGITGDVLGAVNEVTEAALLAAGAILAHNFA
jgi:adenosylcobinamide-GDP ribazoletransferase